MTLPASGTISFSQMQTELGGTNPIAMTEYYGEDTLPASGAISASDFHGVSSMVTPATLSVATQNGGVSESNAWWSSNGPVSVSKTVSSYTLSPVDDGSYSYLWAYQSTVSGSPALSTGSTTGTSCNFSIGSQNPGNGESLSRTETWKLTVSNAKGSVNDTFNITVYATNGGS